MSLSRIVRNVRTFMKPSGTRRKGKSTLPPENAPVLAPKRNTPPHGTTYEPFTLDMADVADALMRGLADSGLAVFRSAPVRPVPVRVTATIPAHKEPVHPLARASKRLVRPEDAERISPAFFRAPGDDGAPGLRVKLSAPVRVSRTLPERPVYPPRPTTPPPIPAPHSEAHSACVTTLAEDDTEELYMAPAWATLFSADTLEMPQAAHLCKGCGELHNGSSVGDRAWKCGGCGVIAQY